MAASVQGGGFDFSIPSVGGTWSWRVRAVNVQGAGQSYELVDINTPYGPLVQTMIPLPGDVVLGMADSLSQLQQQLAPLLALLDPSQTSFSAIIVEGQPNLEIASFLVLNAGSFGSFMTVTATPSAPWLKVEPPSMAGLERNEQGTFSVVLLTGSLLESASPYLATVRLQDNRVPATVIDLSFTVTVLPRPVVAVSPLVVNFTHYLSTSSSTGPVTVTVQNAGPANSSLTWSMARVHNTSPWLAFSPSSGGPLASGATQDSVFSVVPSGLPTVPGTYSDQVRVSSPTASNGFVDVQVFLTVVP